MELPVITYTSNAAVMRRSDLSRVADLLYRWKCSRTTGESVALRHDAEMLKRSINTETQRVTNNGQYCRLLDLYGSHTALIDLMAWAQQRIDAQEYTIGDYLAAFDGDTESAERAFYASTFS